MPAPATQASPVRWRRIAIRLAVVAIGLWSSGWLLHRLASRADGDGAPPGFLAGIAHGALMPMALPRLLLGLDAEIYASTNAGRSYKLGYTCGVNGCGAIFFGLVYRRRARTTSTPVAPTTPNVPTTLAPRPPSAGGAA